MRSLVLGAILLVLGSLVAPVAAQRTYRVRQGDTLIGIAHRFHVRLVDLRRANRLRRDMIRPGMRLVIPGGGSGEGAVPTDLTDAQKAARAHARELGLGTSKVAHALLIHPPDPRWVAAAGDPEGGELEGTLRLPVDGAVLLRGWGSGRNHYHLALDLGAPRGTPVHAAARGIVAYAGRAVSGYGNIVILVHPNGWVTWYAHHRRNLVVAGQAVERGDVIAEVGETGYAVGTHCHFMLVVGGEHCDAQPLLRPPPNHPGGTPIVGPEARWTEARPDEVRCLPKQARPYRRHRRRNHRRH